MHHQLNLYELLSFRAKNTNKYHAVRILWIQLLTGTEGQKKKKAGLQLVAVFRAKWRLQHWLLVTLSVVNPVQWSGQYLKVNRRLHRHDSFLPAQNRKSRLSLGDRIIIIINILIFQKELLPSLIIFVVKLLSGAAGVYAWEGRRSSSHGWATWPFTAAHVSQCYWLLYVSFFFFLPVLYIK